MIGSGYTKTLGHPTSEEIQKVLAEHKTTWDDLFGKYSVQDKYQREEYNYVRLCKIYGSGKAFILTGGHYYVSMARKLAKTDRQKFV